MASENNKYSKGKIYFLMNDINNEIFYIGSTINKLNKRLFHHKSKAFDISCADYDSKKNNYIRLVNIENNEGINNISINLTEEYLFKSREELLDKEKYWIKLFKPICNSFSPLRTHKELCEYRKELYKNRKEYIKNYLKNYSKKYRENNKVKLNEHLNAKVLCDCGRYYTNRNKSRHLKSDYHQNNTK